MTFWIYQLRKRRFINHTCEIRGKEEEDVLNYIKILVSPIESYRVTNIGSRKFNSFIEELNWIKWHSV